MTTHIAPSVMDELRMAYLAATPLGEYVRLPLSGGRIAHIYRGETADQDARDALRQGELARAIPIASFPIPFEPGAYCIIV